MEKKKLRFFTSVYVQDIFAIPLAKYLVTKNMNPNVITLFGLLSSILAGIFYYYNNYYFGSGLFFIALILDSTDGRVARGLGKYSKYGAQLDAIADKIRSVFVMVCLVIGLLGISVESLIIIIFYLTLPLLRPFVSRMLNIDYDPTEYYWYSTKYTTFLKENNLCGLYNGWERAVLALMIGPLTSIPIQILIVSVVLEDIIYLVGIYRLKQFNVVI
jgi:phosphatidylglycerophosphate synthase